MVQATGGNKLNKGDPLNFLFVRYYKHRRKRPSSKPNNEDNAGIPLSLNHHGILWLHTTKSREIRAPGKQCVETTVCLTRHVRVKINMRTLLPSGLVLYTSRPALYPITAKQLVCDG